MADKPLIDGSQDSAGYNAQAGLLKTLSHALELLEELADCEHMPTLTELAKMQGLSKPAMHRLLVTLEATGYVWKDPETRGYQLGLKLWQLGWSAVERLELRRTARPKLKILSENVGHTVLLAVHSPADNVAVYIDKIDTPNPIALYSRVGGTAPLHCSSTGKVLLAFQADDVLEHYLLTQKLRQFTPKTITEPERLQSELLSVRKCGWSLNREEWRIGTSSIGAPVRSSTGEVIAAVAISMLAHLLRDDDLPRLYEAVQTCGHEISESLGYFNGVSDYVRAKSADGHVDGQ